jgi:hypothetical protein
MRGGRLSSAAGGALLALLGMLWPSGVGATPTLMLSASHGQAGAAFTATATFDPDFGGGNCSADSAQFYWDQAAFGQDAKGNQIASGVPLDPNTCTATVSLVPPPGATVGAHQVRAVEATSPQRPQPTGSAGYTVDPTTRPTPTPSPPPPHTAAPAPTARATSTPMHPATSTAAPTPTSTATPTSTPTPAASPSPSPAASRTASPSPPSGGTHRDNVPWYVGFWLGAAVVLGGWGVAYLTVLRGAGKPELTAVSLIGALVFAALLVAIPVAHSR